MLDCSHDVTVLTTKNVSTDNSSAPITGSSWNRSHWTAIVFLGISLLLWIVSLRLVDLSNLDDLGLVAVLPPAYFGALLLLTLGYGLLLSRPRLSETWLLLYNILLILVIHATPNLLYGTLRYSWAWKHVGIVDYIQRYGSVNPTIGLLNIYHNWPGFFALSAFFTEVTGLGSALAFAGWAPAFLNLLFLGAILLAFKAMTPDRHLIWFGVWLFFLTNWVGQDYYSPQGLSYFFYLAILGILLRWFQARQPLFTLSRLQKNPKLEMLIDRYHGYLQPARELDLEPTPQQRLGLGAIVLLLIFAIVSSHQLTPFIALSAVLALVLFSYCRWRSLPLIIFLMILVWLNLPAHTYFYANLKELYETLGKPGFNISSNLANLSLLSRDQIIVANAGRGLSALISLMAIAGFFRRLVNNVLDMPAILLAVSPIPMLLISAYGGEIIFRVYFFALPFAAFLASGLVFAGKPLTQNKPDRVPWRTHAIVSGLSIVLLGGLLLSYYGKERQYYFTAQEVQAAKLIYRNAPTNTLLIEGSRDYPSQFLNYENFTYVPLDREPRETIMRILSQPDEVLGEWMTDDRYSDAYLIITRSQKAYVNALGVMPYGSLERIENLLRQSSNFIVVYDSPDAVVFKHAQ